MNIFQTPRAYVGAFTAYVASLLIMIRAFIRRSHASGVSVRHPSAINVLLALFCVIFFISLFRRTDNLVEKIAITFSSLFFLLWGLETLSGFAFPWLSLNDSLAASLVLCGLATLIVGVRTIQVALGRKA
ncbi:MAG TPA: hypothetical protein VGF96_19700 [Terracidiphilus sp.]|jgi:hypothetical protein